MITLTTKCGKIQGNLKNDVMEFLGVPYATASRFEYAVPVTKWSQGDGSPGSAIFNATAFGNSCPQYRAYYPHFENPARAFYYREFRENQTFIYSEDCLNCNIYAPSKPGKYPVIIYIHGGGFDSGTNCESPFRGDAFARLGIVTVFINYRVGVFGYFTHEKIQQQFGRDGNFGLDDQLTAIKWVKENIGDFYGDSENITLMGQSAGAISIQYLCCNQKNAGLFKNVVMMSGGGKFPDFALPRQPEVTREYWNAFMNAGGVNSFEEFKNLDSQKIFDALDVFKPTRKDNSYNTMPVVDGVLLDKSVKELIKNPLNVNYMLGYTNNDMYGPVLAFVGNKFIKKNSGYIYYFDADPKGDSTKAFHSSDLRYMFNTFESSWRPYNDDDRQLSEVMQRYITNFVINGNPNDESLPEWKKTGRKAMHFCLRKTENQDLKNQFKMVHPSYFVLLMNMLKHSKLV